MFSAAQLRVFLRALVTIDPYAFDDVAEHLAANDENNQQTSEEILLSTIDGLADDKVTGFALRLVLTGHTAIPRESEIDFLTEAEVAFAPPQPKKTAIKKEKAPAPIKAAKKTARRRRRLRSRLQPNPQRESAKWLPLFFQKEEIMFQFHYKLKVAERVKAKCERHPRFNPERGRTRRNQGRMLHLLLSL
jgi:hypothetical protein